MFLDDYLVASMTNVKRRIHLAEKYRGNPVIWQTEPWEAPVILRITLKNACLYALWCS